jgi:hypothetical protein
MSAKRGQRRKVFAIAACLNSARALDVVLELVVDWHIGLPLEKNFNNRLFGCPGDFLKRRIDIFARDDSPKPPV